MNNKLYQVFLAVFDTRSVSKTALLLDISQSGVSSALNRLRAELKDPLFIKTSRGMEPTIWATQMADHIRSAVESLSHVHAAPVAFNPQNSNDEFSILAGDILEAPLLLSTVPELFAKAPNAKLRSASRKPHEIEGALATREIDLAVGYFPQLETTNIITTKISSFTFAAFVRPEHPFANQEVTLEEFCSAKHIAIEAESSLPNIIETWLSARNINRNIVVRTSHFGAVPNLVMQSDLIAITPTDLSGTWFFEGQTEIVRLQIKLPVADIKLYWHRTAHNDQRHRWWRNLVAESLRRVTREIAASRAHPAVALQLHNKYNLNNLKAG